MNACQYCGACCATLRVTFPSDELDDHAGGTVPHRFAESYGNVVAMRTTADGCCIALRGTVGVEVSCAIYDSRPSSCREFSPLASLGRGDEACDEARRRRGMRSLDESVLVRSHQ